MIAIDNFYMIAGNAKDLVAAIDTTEIDFNGFTIKWFLKKGIGAETVLTKDASNGLTSAGKIITIRLNTTDTKTLEPGTYWHECKLYDQNSEETTLFCGDVVLYAG